MARDDDDTERLAKSRRHKKASRYEGELDRYEERLVRLIEELRAAPVLDQRSYEKISRRFGRGDGSFAKSDVIQAYRHLAPRYGWDGEEQFVARIRMKPVRTQSGVAPVTVLTRPHPCPGQCIFCPDDSRMPKSYLALEPGAQRALMNQFDPFRQTWNRLRALYNNGHRLDKVEMIILGGTWTAYPQPYQIWFVKRCLDALNRFDGMEAKPEHSSGEAATWPELLEAQRLNETAPARCVGLSLETRPDELTSIEDVVHIRRLGATKVQIGYQSLDDRILALNRRGHDVAASIRATRLLREAGFKVQAHWMPNLLGADPERDVEDFRLMFADADFRPDELKVYPCCLIEDTELVAHHRSGEWQPYSEKELVEVLVAVMSMTPAYCRLTRVIRDIPSHDIVAGNRVSNLRERVEAETALRGGEIRDIRSRQVKRSLEDLSEVRLNELEYDVSTGRELFLQGETEQGELVGFLRLSLPDRASGVAELGGSAVVREVHVYGTVAGFEAGESGPAQHLGLGGQLLRRAETLARERGYSNLAVISAVGTRDYYRKQGFSGSGLYQHRAL